MALEEQVVKKLIEKNFHISFAESCTGGMCCGTIVNVANASKVLDVSFVTYANEAKIEFLGVKADTILSNGVVSEEVAYEMAQGVANVAKSEVGVGVTGVAGPGGGTAQNVDLYLPFWRNRAQSSPQIKRGVCYGKAS